MRVVHAMRGGPFNRSTLQRQGRTGNQEVFDRFRDFVTTMGQQTMIAHADSQTARDPVEQDRGNHRGPTPKPESREGAEMKDAQENTLTPIDAPFGRHYLRSRLVQQNILLSANAV
jgi:hypothetical protein